MNPWFWFDNPLQASGGGALTTGGALVKSGASLVNGWPNMLSYGTKALPSPAGLPAVIDSALPATVRSALPALMGRAGSLAAGPIGAGAAAAAQVMQPQPANAGEVPFYIIDPKTGKLVLNPAAVANLPGVPSGSYGGGATPQPPAPSALPMTDAFGSMASAPSSVPLPQPRPPAANVGAPMNIMPPQAQQQPQQQPQQPNPSLIQRFIQALSSVQPGSTNQGFYGNLTGSMFPSGGSGGFNSSSSSGAIY